VPMFQLTPPYPARFAGALPVLMLGVLALWSLRLGGDTPAWEAAVYFMGLGLAGAFGGATLWLQARRRRKVSDPTLRFFRVAMLCLMAVPASAVAFEVVPQFARRPETEVWLGVLILPGVFVSAINGMLYKIAPFLNWLHLQRQGGTTVPPNMRQMIPESAMIAQWRLHVAALAALLAAVCFPPLTTVAGLLFAASNTWLGWNLIGGAKRYLTFRDKIVAETSATAAARG
jgi:hypothetical protein